MIMKLRGSALVTAAVLLVLAVAGCGQGSARPASRAGQSPARGGLAARPGAGQIYCPPPVQPGVAIYDPSLMPAAPAWQQVAGRTVILDAGHGGQDEGTSHFGQREKDITLDLALRTAGLLRARGCNVVLTRTSDVFVPLPERSAIANRNPNATFVSIHVNAVSGKPEVSGIETFVLSNSVTDSERAEAASARFRATGGDSVQSKQALATLATRSRAQGPALANSLQRSLVSRLGDSDRGVKSKNLAVLRETYFGPAALVEVGFLSNPRTAARMREDEWRRRTADALCEGICGFLQQPQ